MTTDRNLGFPGSVSPAGLNALTVSEERVAEITECLTKFTNLLGPIPEADVGERRREFECSLTYRRWRFVQIDVGSQEADCRECAVR